MPRAAHHATRWATFIGLALAVTCANCESTASRKKWTHGHFEDGSAAGLFTIELPADATLDPRFGTRTDWYAGESNATGGWLGRDWWIRWSWWWDAQTARTPYLSGSFPTERRRYSAAETSALLNQRVGLDSIPDSSAFAYRGRCYRWRRQLLQVELFQREPADSVAAERLFNSVKFDPMPPWR